MHSLLKERIIEQTTERLSNQNNNSEFESKRRANSLKSAMDSYSEFLNKKTDTHLSDTDFIETQISSFYGHLVKTGMPESSAQTIKNRIRDIRDTFVLNILGKDDDILEFSIVFATLVRNNKDGLVRSKLAEKLGIRVVTFNRWFHGEYYPQAKSIGDLKKIEEYFNLESNGLRKRLGTILFGENTDIRHKKPKTPQTIKTEALTLLEYALPRRRWPLEIEKEFKLLSEFHLLDDFEDTIYENFHRDENRKWGTLEAPTGTYDFFERLVEQFLGFLILPKSDNPALSGLEINIKEISVYLLTDSDYLKQFLKFYKERVGLWTNTHEHMAKRAFALLNPDTALLPQNEEIGLRFMKRYGYGEQYSNWKEYCESNRKKIKQWMKSKKFTSTMTPNFRVREILNNGNAYDVISNTLKVSLEDSFLPGLPINYAATRFRNHLIFLFHILFGFRAAHHSTLEIGKQIQKGKNGWQLYLYKEDLKSKTLHDDDYTTIDLPSDVSDLIELYTTKYRPFLDCENSNYFFIPCKYATPNKTAQLSPSRISSIVKRHTELYLESIFALTSHDARKIIASVTHFVKSQELYESGSIVLGHTFKMNQETYSITKIKTAFYFHFKILQDNGILKQVDEEKKLTVLQSLEKNNYLKDLELKKLKEEIVVLKSNTRFSERGI